MSNQHPSKKPLPVDGTLILSILLVAISVALTVSFFTEKTAWLNTWFELADPSGKVGLERAGLMCGRIIVVLLTTGLTCGTVLYFGAVNRQAQDGYVARAIWDEASRGLTGGTLRPDEVFEELIKGVRPWSRIGAVLEAWKGASPGTDAEMVIEGNVASVRQNLTFLQVLAGALVLVGLIGNFFGLSAAVQQLPFLQLAASAVSEPQAPKPLVQQAEPAPLPANHDIKKSATASTTPGGQPAGSGNEKLGGYLQSISDGLSVVVVSSVMGIFGMIVLMLHVAWLKSQLNAIVTREIVLMAAEISPVLQPPDRPILAKMETAVGAMARVPDELAKFATSAERLTDSMKTSEDNVQMIVRQLQRLLESDLQTTRDTFDRYEVALREFTKVVLDDRASMAAVGETALELYGGLQNVATEIHQLVETSNEVHRAYAASHQGYETYVRAAAKSLEDQQDHLREAYASAHKQVEARTEQVLSRFERAMQFAMESVLNDMGNRLTRSYDDVDAGLKRLQEDQLASVDRLQTRANETFEMLERRLESHISASASVMSDVLVVAHDNGDKALAVLEDARRSLVQGLEDLVTEAASQRLGTEEHHRAEMSEVREAMEKLVRVSEETLAQAHGDAGDKLLQAQQKWEKLYEVASTSLTAAREESQQLYQGATDRLAKALADIQERTYQLLHDRLAAFEHENTAALQRQVDEAAKHGKAALEVLSGQVMAAAAESGRVLETANRILEQGGHDLKASSEAVLSRFITLTNGILSSVEKLSTDLVGQHTEELSKAGLAVAETLGMAADEVKSTQSKALAAWSEQVTGNLEQLEAVRQGVLAAGELWIVALNQQLGGLKAVSGEIAGELRQGLAADSSALRSATFSAIDAQEAALEVVRGLPEGLRTAIHDAVRQNDEVMRAALGNQKSLMADVDGVVKGLLTRIEEVSGRFASREEMDVALKAVLSQLEQLPTRFATRSDVGAVGDTLRPVVESLRASIEQLSEAAVTLRQQSALSALAPPASAVPAPAAPKVFTAMLGAQSRRPDGAAGDQGDTTEYPSVQRPSPEGPPRADGAQA